MNGSRLRHRSAGVNPDLMVAHQRLQFFAVEFREEHLGFLQGHVAIDAVLRDLRAKRLEFSALLRFVARQTRRRKCGCILLRRVRVVASAAGHLAGAEAAAAAEQFHLVAVHVYDDVRAGFGNLEEFLNVVANLKRHSRSDGLD